MLTFVMAASSLALSMPMRTGNRWTWNSSGNVDGLVSATVLDKNRHDSGAVWRLVVRDSTHHLSDTASILERPDGSQSWLKGSKFLVIELQTWNPLGKSHRRETQDTGILLWGEQSTFSPDAGICPRSRFSFDLFRNPGGANGYITANCFEAGYILPQPRGIWIDSIGVLAQHSRSLLAPGSGTDLHLLEFNGRTIDPTVYTAKTRFPPVGSTLEWQETFYSQTGYFANKPDSTRTHRWTILGIDRGTDGSRSVRVRDSSKLDTGLGSDRIQTFQFHPDDWVPELFHDVCPGPEDAWLSDASDSLGATGILRSVNRYSQRISATAQMDSVF